MHHGYDYNRKHKSPQQEKRAYRWKIWLLLVVGFGIAAVMVFLTLTK